MRISRVSRGMRHLCYAGRYEPERPIARCRIRRGIPTTALPHELREDVGYNAAGQRGGIVSPGLAIILNQEDGRNADGGDPASTGSARRCSVLQQQMELRESARAPRGALRKQRCAAEGLGGAAALVEMCTRFPGVLN